MLRRKEKPPTKEQVTEDSERVSTVKTAAHVLLSGEEAALYLSNLGVPELDVSALVFEKDLYYLPPNLHELPMPDIRRRHNAMYHYVGWFKVEKAKLEVAADKIEEMREDRKADLKRQSSAEKWKFDLHIRNDIKWKSLNKRLVDVQGKIKLLSSQIEVLEGRCFILSREQSSRETEMRTSG